MPKNKGKGGNKRKRGKKILEEEHQLRFKEDNEEYAQIIKVLGDRRFLCKCTDDIERIAHARGKLKKKVWIVNDDIVLVSIRQFESEKCDIIWKYTEKEILKLKNGGEIPESMLLANNSEKETVFTDSDIKFVDQEIIKNKTEKTKDKTGFEIESENEEEKEDGENGENNTIEKEEKEKDEEKREEKMLKEVDEEKELKNKKAKKEKDRNRKNNRDKRRKVSNDDREINIDCI